MNKLKKMLHGIFRLTGREFLPYTPDNFYSLQRLKILTNKNINLILDIGAHNGTYCEQLRDDGYKGQVISFEPLKKPFLELEEKANNDPYWDCEQVALGDSIGETTINVSGHLTSSSILPISDGHITAMPSSETIKTETIKVSTLDSLREKYIKPGNKVLMKVDVQGYEKHVLNGAKSALDQIQIIELELSLSKMYEGGPLLMEMLSFMDNLGFSLIAINRVFSDPNTGHLLQADGLFIKKIRSNLL